jgi:uncharacterized protein
MSSVRELVDQYLREHNSATLATCGEEGPWSAAVFYAHDAGFSLYFLTDPATHHGQDLAHNHMLAAAVHEDYRDWRQIRGIQLVGSASPVTGVRDQARAWALYLGKFPFVKDFLGAPGEFVDAYSGKMGKVRFYRLSPSRIWYTDNQKHFGRRDILEPGPDGTWASN